MSDLLLLACLLLWCVYQLASTLAGAHNVYYVKSLSPQIRWLVNNNKCCVRQVWPISVPFCCVVFSVAGLTSVGAASGIGEDSIAIAVRYFVKIRGFS